MSETSWKTKSSWKKGNTHFEFFGDLDVRWDVFEAVADQVDHGVCAIWLKWILERKQFVPHGPIKLQIEMNRNYSLRMWQFVSNEMISNQIYSAGKTTRSEKKLSNIN